MTSFFDEIARNRLKSALLFFIFFLFFTGIILVFALFLGVGPLGGLIIGAALVAVYALFSYFAGGAMVLKISRAQKADPKQYHYLYDVVEGLSSSIQVKMPGVYIINDPNPNAFATGRNRNHAYVAVTTGLLSMMDKKELQGVLAHELSHVQDNDILYMLIAVAFAGAIGLIAAVIRTSIMFGGLQVGGGRRNGNNGIILLVALVLGILAPLFALLLRLAISRRREYMADANGARLIRDPHSLASALAKIRDYTKNPQTRPVMHANDITSSLYFSNPLKGGFSNLFSTHPPIDERIKRLQQMY
jgi:heat shock protein HtpX